MYAAKANGKNRLQLFGESMRSYLRVEADVEGSLRLFGNDSVPLTCVNLSEGGLCFLADRSIEAGATSEVTLELPGSDGGVSLTCRVVEAIRTDSGRYLVGSRILNMDPKDHQRLTHYLNDLKATGR